MFTSLFKNHKKFGILAIMKYMILGFIILVLLFFSWLFLFVYRHLYSAIVQETAIINLKSQLVITRVHKIKFNNIVKKYETKQEPLTVINFKILKNPFKSEVTSND